MDYAKEILLSRRELAAELDRLCDENEGGVFDVQISILQDQLGRIDRAIMDIDDTRLRDVLMYKYIRGGSNAQTADAMRYSVRHIKRLHRRAVAAFKENYFD